MFVKALRVILIEVGVQPEDAKRFTFYSLRRFMPTLAAAVKLDPTSASALGNWQFPGVTSSSSASSARFSMAAHYSGEKMAQAMRAKSWPVGAILEILEKTNGDVRPKYHARNSGVAPEIPRPK